MSADTGTSLVGLDNDVCLILEQQA
jgi:hypothetical protein